MKKNTASLTQQVCYLASWTQAIIVNLAPVLFITLQEHFFISYEKLGRLVLVNFVTQLAMDLIAHPLVKRFGYRTLMVVAHVSSAAGLFAFAATPLLLPGAPYAGFTLATVLYSLGGGLLEVLTSPIVDNLPSEAKAAAMSLLHSFYCWGQLSVILLTTLLLFVLGGSVWPWVMVAWAALPIYNALRFALSPLILPDVAAEPPQGQKSFLKHAPFWIMMLAMIAAGASEQVMAQWASAFAEKGLALSKIGGDLAGPCAFALMMALCRMLYGIYGARIPMALVLRLCPLLGLAAYLVAAFSGLAVFSLIACALCGVAVSLMWPGTLSGASGRFPGAGSLLFALMAVGGDLGCSLGPWMAGLVTDSLATAAGGASLGLRMSMVTGAIFCGLFFLATLCTQAKNKEVIV